MATQSKNISETMAPTENEIYKLENALKDEEFRRLLCDYAKERNDPASRALYESEVVQMERARGFDCTFLHPRPGYVLKTTNLRNDEKVFVNVCSDEAVDVPVSRPEGLTKAVKWSLPYVQSQLPRKDADRRGRPCTVYDVVFYPTAVAFRDPRLRALVAQTALSAVEKAFEVKLEHDNLRFPKMKFKGAFAPTVIRRLMTKEERAAKGAEEGGLVVESDEDLGVERDRMPEYVVKFRHRAEELRSTLSSKVIEDPCRPSEIVVEINLAGLTSTQGVDLDITEARLTLESTEPVAYALTVPFPYPVMDEKATAKFDKCTHKLVVCVPVRPRPDGEKETEAGDAATEAVTAEMKRLVSTDSGIDVEDAVYCEESQQKQQQQQPKSSCDDGDLMFPAYSCNIYEDLMIFTLDVKNVDESTLVKTTMSDEQFGFGVKLSTVGAGQVAFNFGFYCALVLPNPPPTNASYPGDPSSCVDVEVWDNNVIVKVSLPRGIDCDQYKVGCNPADLTIHSLPQLRALRKRKEKLMKKSEDRSLSIGEDDAFEAPASKTTLSVDEAESDKERHSSGGDSDDSLLSGSSSNSREELKNGSLKSILKQRKQRCFSESQKDLLSWVGSSCASRSSSIVEEEEEEEESAAASAAAAAANVGSKSGAAGRKKSVRFSAVVQRQIFRPTSSISGPQTQKNLKKKQAKLRRADRRASEGDADDLREEEENEEEEDEEAEQESHDDSGVASSVDDSGTTTTSSSNGCGKSNNRKSKKAKRKGNKKVHQQQKFWSESTNDLMFDLDI